MALSPKELIEQLSAIHFCGGGKGVEQRQDLRNYTIRGVPHFSFKSMTCCIIKTENYCNLTQLSLEQVCNVTYKVIYHILTDIMSLHWKQWSLLRHHQYVYEACQETACQMHYSSYWHQSKHQSYKRCAYATSTLHYGVTFMYCITQYVPMQYIMMRINNIKSPRTISLNAWDLDACNSHADIAWHDIGQKRNLVIVAPVTINDSSNTRLIPFVWLNFAFVNE